MNLSDQSQHSFLHFNFSWKEFATPAWLMVVINADHFSNSVLTALLTYLWCSDHWDRSPWGLFCILAAFPSQVMLLFYVVRDHVYSSLESGWKWHKFSNSSRKPSSARCFSCFWPSGGRRSVFRIGQDSQLHEGANASFIQRKIPRNRARGGCKHFSYINSAGGVGQESEGGEQTEALRRWWAITVLVAFES